MSTTPFPINRVYLSGVVSSDPIIHYLAPAFPEALLSLVTTEGQLAEKRLSESRRLYHRIVARGDVGLALEHVQKGDSLSVVGSLNYVANTDREGKTRWETEIIASEVYIQKQQTSIPQNEGKKDQPRFDFSAYEQTPGEEPFS